MLTLSPLLLHAAPPADAARVEAWAQPWPTGCALLSWAAAAASGASRACGRVGGRATGRVGRPCGASVTTASCTTGPSTHLNMLAGGGQHQWPRWQARLGVCRTGSAAACLQTQGVLSLVKWAIDSRKSILISLHGLCCSTPLTGLTWRCRNEAKLRLMETYDQSGSGRGATYRAGRALGVTCGRLRVQSVATTVGCCLVRSHSSQHGTSVAVGGAGGHPHLPCGCHAHAC